MSLVPLPPAFIVDLMLAILNLQIAVRLEAEWAITLQRGRAFPLNRLYLSLQVNRYYMIGLRLIDVHLIDRCYLRNAFLVTANAY
jgi:hypothetical protein